MRKSRARIVAATAIAASVVAACGSNTTSDGAGSSGETGVVKLGLLTSMSGQFGAYGEPFRDGAAFGVHEINENGGFTVDGQKYTFDLKVVDDKSDQATAVQGATQLINDEGVPAIIGPIGPLGPSVTQLTSASQVVNFSSSSSVSAIAGPPDNPLTFITNGSGAKKVQAAVDAIKAWVPEAKTVAVLGPDDETTAGLTPQFEKALDAAGVAMNTYTYPTGTKDLSTVITRLVADKPDAVILGWANTDRATQAPQLKAAGLSESVPVLLYADSNRTCTTLFKGRPCINHPLAGADLTSPSLDSSRARFVERFLKFTDQSELPEQVAAVLWTYDFPAMLAQAMEKAGTVTDTEAIGKALHEVSREGLLGTITFDEANKATFGFDLTHFTADGTATTKNFG